MESKESFYFGKHPLKEGEVKMVGGASNFKELVNEGAKMITEIADEIQKHFNTETPDSVELLLASLRHSKAKAETMLMKMQKYFMSNTLELSQSHSSEISISNWGSLEGDFDYQRSSRNTENRGRSSRNTENDGGPSLRASMGKAEQRIYEAEKETFEEVQAKLQDTIRFIESSERIILEKKPNYSLNKNSSIGRPHLMSFDEYVFNEQIKKFENPMDSEELSHYNKNMARPTKSPKRQQTEVLEFQKNKRKGFFQRIMKYCGTNN